MTWLFSYSLVVEIIMVYDQVEDVLGEMGVEALTLHAIFLLHKSKVGLLLIILGTVNPIPNLILTQARTLIPLTNPTNHNPYPIYKQIFYQITITTQKNAKFVKNGVVLLPLIDFNTLNLETTITTLKTFKQLFLP